MPIILKSKMKPKISVIVPVYNIEMELQRCLVSIMFQSFKDIEIIVIDDGSTDRSLRMCKCFQENDERIRVFHTKNHGLSHARNLGLSKARGEYIVFVDGDDNVDPEFLKELFTAATENDADIAICGYINSYDMDFSVVCPRKSEILSGEDAAIRLLTKQKNLEILAWNKLYKKSLFRGIKYPVGEICEDNFTTYKLLARAKKVFYVPEPLYIYERRDNSISFKMKDLKRDKLRERVAKESEKYFEKNARLKFAATEARLLSYFKFIDHALAGRINKKYFEKYRAKILNEKAAFLGNIFIDRKRKNYIKMLSTKNGTLYKIFRKIKHD